MGCRGEINKKNIVYVEEMHLYKVSDSVFHSKVVLKCLTFNTAGKQGAFLHNSHMTFCNVIKSIITTIQTHFLII